MDDILILGTSKKHINMAVNLICKFAKEKLKLEIKPSKIVFPLKDHDENRGRFIDMMGFRVYRKHVGLRRRVYKCIHRMIVRCQNKINQGIKPSIKQCRRFMCYHG